jgi:hypothetical protein
MFNWLGNLFYRPCYRSRRKPAVPRRSLLARRNDTGRCRAW